jgi:hypothetical protein
MGYIFGGGASLANSFMLRTDSQRTLGWIAVGLFFGVPLLSLVTFLVRRSLKMRTGGRYIGGGFLLLWIAGFITMGLLASSLKQDFYRTGELSEPVAIPQPASGKLVLAVPSMPIEYSQSLPWLHGDITGWDVTNDTMRSALVEVQASLSPDSLYHVVLHRRSRGRTQEEAEARASHLRYAVTPQAGTDSILALSNGYAIAAKDAWRAQHVIVEVQVPAGKVIRLDGSVKKKLSGEFTEGPDVDVFTESQGYRGHRKSWRVTRYRTFGTALDSDVDYRMSPAGTLIALNGSGSATIANDPDRRDDAAEIARDRRIDSIDRAVGELERQRDLLRERGE